MPALFPLKHAAAARRSLVILLMMLTASILGLLAPGWATAATPTPAPSPAAKPDAATPVKDRATFGIGPATNGSNDARPFFSYTSGSGGIYSDTVAVSNYSPKPLDLLIYATDLVNGSDGALSVAPQDVPARNAGLWVKLPAAQQTVHVPPSGASGPGKVVLPITLQVPAGASPGDHNAGIVASLQTLGKNPAGQNVRLDQRVATRVYVRVKGPVRSELTVTNVTVDYEGTNNPIGKGVAHVKYRLRNFGNVNVGARQAVTVTGLFGTMATAPPIPNQDLLLPGASVWMTVDVPGVLPTIFQNAHITVTPQEVKGSLAGPATVTTKSVSFHAIPWMLILIVVAVLLLIIAAVLIRRRRRRRPPTRPAGGGPKSRNPEPTGPSDDDDASAGRPDESPVAVGTSSEPVA